MKKRSSYLEHAAVTVRDIEWSISFFEDVLGMEVIRRKEEKHEMEGHRWIYNTMHSPFRHAPQKQKKFDQRAAQELLRRYPQDAVAWAVQELSPLGKRMGQYGKRLVQETAKTVER